MKARYATFSVEKIDKEIRKEVIKEVDKYKNEVYDNVCWDVFRQALAILLHGIGADGLARKAAARISRPRRRCVSPDAARHHGARGHDQRRNPAPARCIRH